MSLNDMRKLDHNLQLIKTYQKRIFIIINEAECINFIDLYEQYIKLRPQNMTLRMFFIGYRNGKCINQRVGIHTIARVPKIIANFLCLKNSDKYMGHSF